MPKSLLEVQDLQVHFRTRRGTGLAVDGVTFSLGEGEVLGVVGESGSGKSVMALSLVGLHPRPAAHVVGGSVDFDGENLLQASGRRLQQIRGAEIAMVFQDPNASLNPVFTIGDQIFEPLRVHTDLPRSSYPERARELFSSLRIPEPSYRLRQFPHQFSGGMKQRVLSAIALSCDPRLLIADEPTTALDVTVQAAYLQLLKDIQQQRGLSILFITHDFGVVSRVCDRVIVMYAGQIVEAAMTETLFRRPSHPYSVALLKSVPDVRTEPVRLASIPGQPPSIYNVPDGCRFRPRCWLYQHLGEPERCRREMPPLRATSDGSDVRCHFDLEDDSMDDPEVIANSNGTLSGVNHPT